MKLWVKVFIILVISLFSCSTWCSFSNITLHHSYSLGKITLIFYNRYPIYHFFLHNFHYIMLDINRKNKIKSFFLNFNKKNFIQHIYTKLLKHSNAVRLILQFTHVSQINIIKKKYFKKYQIIFKIYGNTILKKNTTLIYQIPFRDSNTKNNISCINGLHFFLKKNDIFNSFIDVHFHKKIVIAIDAGHGGQDPGASGQHGLHEKNITMIIAKKLKYLMDKNIFFKPILIRKGDYFVSVLNRADIARKNKAILLLSLHADAAANILARGASVWILSNRRANNEMANWLERKERQSKLFWSPEMILSNQHYDFHFSQALLDLQFSHSQHISYELGIQILQHLQTVMLIHKPFPEYGSLGVLRSPDIPSILIEVGFISNKYEEILLNKDVYQKKIAWSIYRSLCNYFLKDIYS